MAKDIKNKNLSDIQKKVLLLVEFVHKICIDNKIGYSLDCGSLIGAVREKGFIEWDDDADILFRREEYDRFINVIKQITLPDCIGVYYPEDKKEFLDFNVRIYYKNESVREDAASRNLYDGIFSYATLDLYVLDNIPESKFSNRMYVLKQQIIFGLAMSKRHDIKYFKYGFKEKIAIKVLSLVGKLFSIKQLCKLYNECATKYTGKTNKYYCTSWSPEYPGYQFESDLFDEYILSDFENLKLCIPKEYDRVLKIEYGDNYMQPIKTHDHEHFVEKL
ncbi:MAG: LicD family protein [Lachnospiraceae bacterium]|nr:LicD family protein [Lachnospiraceae bacterium]